MFFSIFFVLGLNSVFLFLQDGKPVSDLFKGVMEFEPPNKNIHNFIGTLKLAGMSFVSCFALFCCHILKDAMRFVISSVYTGAISSSFFQIVS